MSNSKLSILNSGLLFKCIPWVAFVLALVAYWLTVDPGASYWDCPEYLITALKLEVGHPPGNPGWSLVHRVASCFFSDPALQVRVVNMLSGLFTALAVMILCSISISVMRWIWPSGRDGRWRVLAISLASLSGSLCFAFSDSAWYSAVEAEVYAMSLFLSSLTVWISLKWAFARGQGSRTRWIVALFYVIGFSLGVHQLNLLALPAIAMIMASAQRKAVSGSILRIIIAFFAGCAVVGLILKGLMPGSVALAGMADLFAVNTLRLPYWSGAILFWCASLTVVIACAVVSRHFRQWLSTSFWCLAAVMVGFSVYIIIPVRAYANPPLNEGNPSDVFRLADYLDRRQYGKNPVFYGRTPYSRIMREERITVDAKGDTLRDYSWNAMKVKGKDMRPFVKNGKIPARSRFLGDADKKLNDRISADASMRGYVVAGFRTDPIYTPELDMWFPRIHASTPGDIASYEDWTGMDSANMVQVRISEAFDSVGRPVPVRNAEGEPQVKYAMRPTYFQSALYMLVYQMGYMYMRYLLWNYAGRQNDVPSTGELDHGNFLTGLDPLDDALLGSQSKLPPELGVDNEGRNLYWSVPFLIGVVGLFWLFFGVRSGRISLRMRRTACISLVLFLMTGLAIVFYLNQTPGEPRERDYSFLGSFWVFAFWIAAGMLLLLRAARFKLARGLAVLAVVSVPLWMLAENYRDHDRSGRSATLDYASNLLESLDEDAILFVDGDNYIFPLWFAQEVMGVRRDVAVVCYSYLPCDWYVRQLMLPRYGYDGISMCASEGDIALGNFNLVRFPSAVSDTVSAIEALKSLFSDQSQTPSFKSRGLIMGRDTLGSWTFDLLSVPGKSSGSMAGLREVAVLDIIASNEAARYPRPVYWHQSLQKNKYCGFFPFTRQALFTRRLMPHAPDSLVLVDEALNALPLLRWGGLDRSPYPGPDVSNQAALQRASLIRLAQCLSEGDRHQQALHVARSAMVRYPSRVVPFSIRTHIDSAYFEARELSKVLKRSGEALGDTAALSLASRIQRDDSIRVLGFRQYRDALHPSRRSALSPSSRNHSL